MDKSLYIHYGSKYFNKEIFKPIMNRINGVKPYGGFWASKADAKYGWRDWCIANDWYNPDATPYTVFTLNDSSRVYTINTVKDLDWLVEYGLAVKVWSTGIYFIDFEMMTNRYDAIEVNMSNDFAKLYKALYSWDCDSILIMNPDIIEEVKG